ncbi:MAG: LysR substrate-binding domain-containing protein [Pseudomonadota bacterium]
MARRHYRLPSLSALDAFEAAARQGSFKEGARELNVTASAVSHQIKALESELGVTLFDRGTRGVQLNRDGAALRAALEQGFGHIADAVARVRAQTGIEAVRIMATTAMSHLWLTPQLGRFWREHGTIQVNQHVTDSPWSETQHDLVIRYGDIGAESGDCQQLFGDVLRPLASPAFCRANPVAHLADLAQLPLIHLNAPDRHWTGWHDWLSRQGYSGPVRDGLSVNNYVIALQAAQDGMGVVLGWERMTRPLLSRGALRRLGQFQMPAPKMFYIVKTAGSGAKATLLRDWLVSAARALPEDASGGGIFENEN